MWDKIRSLFTARSDPHGYTVYVACDRCGEKLKTRINKAHDLSVEYGARQGKDTYFCRKVLSGDGPCFQRIEVELTFDERKRVIDKEISGGRFISREEYMQG
ncbi:MAG: hypothetical protein KGY46_08385 [Anaerolineales bacterium]|nr:hypothetical protein [Anaerolineales bacterium]